ncbi:SulP family inorganic anion transporter [Sphingomonas daechungensis]|uniref:SulP family inorganic anion transporter n=1 Tax=Sphingomonas daechungensis TaxID=1176646 RepID=UPI003783F28C
MTDSPTQNAAGKAATPTFAELFTPKLVTVMREGYGLSALRDDAVAGLTVAIVAIPLCMAIAIASGLPPDRGLFTAIIGGFLISAFGGSRFQIGGPAGAFIVLVASVVERHGYEGLVLATAIAGALMLAVGFLRLGTYIKYIPYPVTVGFTSGIAVIIFASQIKEILGLDLPSEPAALVPKIEAIAGAISTADWRTMAISLLALVIIIGLRRVRPNWPGFLIAVGTCSVVAVFLTPDVATIGSRFGGIPDRLPAPSVPHLDFEKIRSVFPDAVAIAILGSIESLLSALVADGMTGRRHRSNCELVAQGGANIAAVIFGGMPVTGTIARTATNVRAGARGPVSGLLHAVYVLAFVMVAAPLASYVPLAALGAVLAIVSWNMAEREEFVSLIRSSPGDALVLLATFLLTVFEDLTLGISVGVTLGAFLFLHRMAEATEIEGGAPLVAKDEADGPAATRIPYAGSTAQDPDIVIYKINGAFFFGATANVISTLERIGKMPRAFVLDFDSVPLVDATAAKSLEAFARRLQALGSTLYIAGARVAVRRALLRAGLREPHVHFVESVQQARTASAMATT